MTTRARVPLVLLALALALASQAGCSSQGVNTEVVVEVDAEPLVREMATTLVVRVWSGRRNGPIPQTIELLQPLSVSGPVGRWPRTVLLTPRTRGDTESFYRFEASAYRETSPDPDTDVPIATVRLISGYGRDQTIHVRLLLQDACIGRECGEDETCDRDRCVPAQIDDITMFDGGPLDASTMDGGMPGDGSVPGDAGCAATGCDDGNECTVDTCRADGTCANEPDVGRDCIGDGLFCNGSDSCDDTGACVSSGVDPCSAPTTCDEATSRCLGCATSSDCAPGPPSYGACVPDSGPCPTTGLRQGTVETFTCVDNACASAGTMPAAPLACDVTSDGTMCGSPTTTRTPCRPVSATSCSGILDVTTTTPVCGGGSCSGRTAMTSESCLMPSGSACVGPSHCSAATCTATGACMAVPVTCDGGVPDAGPQDAGFDPGPDAGLDAGFPGPDAGFPGPDASFPGFDSGFMMSMPDASIGVDEL